MRSAGTNAKLYNGDEGSGRRDMSGESEEENRRKNIMKSTT